MPALATPPRPRHIPCLLNSRRSYPFPPSFFFPWQHTPSRALFLHRKLHHSFLSISFFVEPSRILIEACERLQVSGEGSPFRPRYILDVVSSVPLSSRRGLVALCTPASSRKISGFFDFLLLDVPVSLKNVTIPYAAPFKIQRRSVIPSPLWFPPSGGDEKTLHHD